MSDIRISYILTEISDKNEKNMGIVFYFFSRRIYVTFSVSSERILSVNSDADMQKKMKASNQKIPPVVQTPLFFTLCHTNVTELGHVRGIQGSGMPREGSFLLTLNVLREDPRKFRSATPETFF